MGGRSCVFGKMLKKLNEFEDGSLGIKFSSEEVKMWGITKEDKIDISDMLVEKRKKRRTKCKK